MVHQNGTSVEELYNENLRLRQVAAAATVSPPGSLTGYYVGGVVLISLIGVAAIVGILVLQPEKDNTTTIATILGFIVPINGALLAAALREVHVAFNSRMTELLVLTKKAALAEGQLREKEAAAVLAPTSVTGVLPAIEKNTADTVSAIKEQGKP